MRFVRRLVQRPVQTLRSRRSFGLPRSVAFFPGDVLPMAAFSAAGCFGMAYLIGKVVMIVNDANKEEEVVVPEVKKKFEPAPEDIFEEGLRMEDRQTRLSMLRAICAEPALNNVIFAETKIFSAKRALEEAIRLGLAFDDTASTSTATLLNTIFQVLWPTMVAPKIMRRLKSKPIVLGGGGDDSKGYHVNIESGTLSNLVLEFTHIGVVKTSEAIAKPFYERGMHTWTSDDVHAWIADQFYNTDAAGLKLTQERLLQLEANLVEKSFNGAGLVECNAKELKDHFKLTEEESLGIIQMRDEFESLDMEELAKRFSTAEGDVLTEAVEAKEGEEVNLANRCTCANMDVEIKISGKPHLDVVMENESILKPNIEVDIEGMEIDAKIRIQVDPTNEEIRIGFFEAPKVRLNLDIELSHIPLIGESRFLEKMMERKLRRHTVRNPIRISLGDDGDAKEEEAE